MTIGKVNLYDPKQCKLHEAETADLAAHLKAMATAAQTAEAKKGRISRYAMPEQRSAMVADIDQAAYRQIREHRQEAERLLAELREKREIKRRRARLVCEPTKAAELERYERVRDIYHAKVHRWHGEDVMPEYQAAVGRCHKFAILDLAQRRVDAMADVASDDPTTWRELAKWQGAVREMQQDFYADALEVDRHNEAAIVAFQRNLTQQYGAVEEQQYQEYLERTYGVRFYPEAEARIDAMADQAGGNPEPIGRDNGFTESVGIDRPAAA